MSEITEFKYFPRLPPELGLLVWSEVIDNDPRVIEVSGGHVANPRLPALMLACKESAAEMRKRYHKKLTKGFFFSARNIDVTSKRRGCLLFPHTDIILIPVQDSVFCKYI